MCKEDQIFGEDFCDIHYVFEQAQTLFLCSIVSIALQLTVHPGTGPRDTNTSAMMYTRDIFLKEIPGAASSLFWSSVGRKNKEGEE